MRDGGPTSFLSSSSDLPSTFGTRRTTSCGDCTASALSTLHLIGMLGPGRGLFVVLFRPVGPSIYPPLLPKCFVPTHSSFFLRAALSVFNLFSNLLHLRASGEIIFSASNIAFVSVHRVRCLIPERKLRDLWVLRNSWLQIAFAFFPHLGALCALDISCVPLAALNPGNRNLTKRSTKGDQNHLHLFPIFQCIQDEDGGLIEFRQSPPAAAC